MIREYVAKSCSVVPLPRRERRFPRRLGPLLRPPEPYEREQAEDGAGHRAVTKVGTRSGRCRRRMPCPAGGYGRNAAWLKGALPDRGQEQTTADLVIAVIDSSTYFAGGNLMHLLASRNEVQ